MSLGYSLPEMGASVARDWLEDLTFVQTLEFYEGERLCLYRNRTKEPYLKIWFDVGRAVSDAHAGVLLAREQSSITRWLFVRCTDVDVQHYLGKHRTLRQLIVETRDGFAYVVDADTRDGGVARIAVIKVSAIDPELLPGERSFFDSDLGYVAPKDEYTFLIDGDSWSGEKFSNLERRFKDVYSFIAPFGEHGVSTRKLKDAFTGYRYKGGWNHGRTFKRLRREVPTEKRIALDAVSYASPGFVRFRVDPTLGTEVKRALARLSARHQQASADYRALHHALLELGRLHANRSRREEYAVLLASLAQLTENLVRSLGGLNLARIREAANSNENAAHVVATYYRRLREVMRFDRAADRNDEEVASDDAYNLHLDFND